MKFDKDYYHGIWPEQGVHRHDYAPSHAQRIINMFGCKVGGRPLRLLDVGCGCGIVVKLLRDAGIEAFGCDVSDYAYKNRCTEWVVQADARHLPYPSGFFDVVASNGLLEYIPEDDVDSTIRELKRVGATQWHQIDTEECQIEPEFQIITLKSQVWWDNKLI